MNISAGIGPKLSSSISNSNNNLKYYLKNPISDKYVFANSTPELVIETTNMLKTKKSAGDDNISTHYDWSVLPVSYIFKLSFKTEYIPKEY